MNKKESCRAEEQTRKLLVEELEPASNIYA